MFGHPAPSLPRMSLSWRLAVCAQWQRPWKRGTSWLPSRLGRRQPLALVSCQHNCGYIDLSNIDFINVYFQNYGDCCSDCYLRKLNHLPQPTRSSTVSQWWLPVTLKGIIFPFWDSWRSKVKREQKHREVPHLKYIIIRCFAWGFSTSGVERSFSSGNWLRSRREVTQMGANDELRALHYPVEHRDELLDLYDKFIFSHWGSLRLKVNPEHFFSWIICRKCNSSFQPVNSHNADPEIRSCE